MSRHVGPTFMTEQEVLPSRLRELMREGNVTQEQLGEALGVRRQTVSLYMTGQSKPDWTQVAKMSAFFNVPSDYLLGITDNKLRANMDFGVELGLSDYAIRQIKWIADNSSRFGWNPLDFLLNTRFIKELFSLSWSSKLYLEDKEKGLFEIGVNQEIVISEDELENIFDKNKRTFAIINSKEMVDLKMHIVQTRFNQMLEGFKYQRKSYELKKVNNDATEIDT